MATASELIKLAKTRLGEEYLLGSIAPKANKNWHGPWDCAEFASWCIFQTTGGLFGCRPRNGDPNLVDAYTGYWREDAEKHGCTISVSQASATPGAFLLRYPGSAIGHVAISVGDGTTIEAHSRRTGVMKGSVNGRRWDTGVAVPGVHIQIPATPVPVVPAGLVLRVKTPRMTGRLVKDVQRALHDAGFRPGKVDGIYGGQTAGAVRAFQLAKGLAVDGEVGPLTARSLGISLT